MKQLNSKIGVLLACLLLSIGSLYAQNKKPNILWIVAEDLSPFMGCYNDPINSGHTPVIDQLASEGMVYQRAYATAPVCSAARSAFITGVYQTTTGFHEHRSSRVAEGVTPDELRIHLPKGMKTIPELMRENGYFTFNSGKDDYNFFYDRRAMYNVGTEPDYKVGMNGWQGNHAEHMMSVTEDTWGARKDKDQPWFGQIQIMGGKRDYKYVRKGEKLEDNDVPMPPYFPKGKHLQEAWTKHYNANRGSDVQVEKILTQLEKDGELENTIIFFFSDHGSCTSLRHKQFCYEGGMRVPLVIKGNIPQILPGSVNNNLVSLLDVSATTLALGGVKLPKYLDGQNLFAKNYKAPNYMIGARDRCDFTIDRIRTVRSDRFRYIRNYHPDRPMLQPSYRDTHSDILEMKKLRAEGKMTKEQENYWFGQRPAEELYDMQVDPMQLHNLANDPLYADVVKEHRSVLEKWVKKTDDKGQYPEDPNQLRETYKWWKDRKQFKNADKVNPEYNQFM